MLLIDIERAMLVQTNHGKEGKGEGMVTRLDLKFKFNAPAVLLNALMKDEKLEANEFLWKGGKVREGLAEIKIDTSFFHNNLEFGAGFFGTNDTGVQCNDCTVKKIVLRPLDGCLLEISLTAQVRNPDADHLKAISDITKHDGSLKIEFDPELQKIAADAAAAAAQKESGDMLSEED